MGCSTKAWTCSGVDNRAGNGQSSGDFGIALGNGLKPARRRGGLIVFHSEMIGVLSPTCKSNAGQGVSSGWGLAWNSKRIVNVVFRVIPGCGEGRQAGRGGIPGQRAVLLAEKNKIHEILDLDQPVRRQSLDFLR